MSARRVVAQSAAHVRRTEASLKSWFSAVPPSPYGDDLAAARRGENVTAYNYRLAHIGTTSAALLSHLEGVHALLQNGSAHMVSALTVARALTEVSASTVLILEKGLAPDERAARSYAALFRSIAVMGIDNPEQAALIREKTIADLRGDNVQVRRRIKGGSELQEVAQVRVGNASARTEFKYSVRVAEQIPGLRELYSYMSRITHGDFYGLSTTRDMPTEYARVIGVTAFSAVSAWSEAIHAWVGVDPAPFVNADDIALGAPSHALR